MGNFCPFLSPPKQTKPITPQKKIQPQIQASQRALNNMVRIQTYPLKRQLIIRKPPPQIKKLSRSASGLMCSSGVSRKTTQAGPSSLLFQGEIFDRTSIILFRDLLPTQQFKPQQCYTLIENVFLVKKSLDSIKVTTPHDSFQLKCPMNTLSPTFFLFSGIPMDTIRKHQNSKIFMQFTQSLIHTQIKLTCKNCQKIYNNYEQFKIKSKSKLSSKSKNEGLEQKSEKKESQHQQKHQQQQNPQKSEQNSNKSQFFPPSKPRIIKRTYSTSIIYLKQLQCGQCCQKGQWRLLQIVSNFVIWGNGQKMRSDLVYNEVPNVIRAMGCVSCLDYVESVRLICGCFMCVDCYREIDDKKCKLCNLNPIIS